MKNLDLRGQDIKIKIGILTAFLAGIFALFFFKSYSNILTTSKIFSTSEFTIIFTILLPILLFAFCLYFLTFSLLCIKKYFPIFVIPLAFILSQTFSLLTIGSGICIMISFLIFGKFFLKNLTEFKKPSISRCMKSAFGLPFLILSIVIAFNFYPQYSKEISVDDSLISGKILTKIKSIIVIGPDNYENQNNSTISLLDYSKNLLQNQKISLTDTNIKLQEKKIMTFYEVNAVESDKMTSIYTKALNKQIVALFHEYRTQILLIIPLIFFLISQTFSSTSSYLVYFAVILSEKIAKMRKVNIYKLFSIE